MDDNGTVFVKEGDTEREVGQFPDASKEEALALYARRFLDLKAKLDLLSSRLTSPNVKAREIDESLKLLGEETSEPAVVGDVAALKKQFETLKTAGEAKKTELSEARKAAVAKAVEERTAIVEKAEALTASLGDNTNWRSTADKFRNLFDEWQNHQRTTIRIDKPEAEALWKRFSAARTTFNQSRRKWAQARDNERSQAKEAKEAIIAEANELKDSTAWGETSRKFNELMDRWKKAGRAGRNEDDALWAKFPEAAEQYQLIAGQGEKMVATPEGKARLSEVYHNMGNIFMQNKDYGKAVEVYKQSLRLNPKDDETRYNLALAQKLLSDQQNQDQSQDQQNDDKQENKDQKDDQQQQQQQQPQDDQKQDKTQEQQQSNEQMSKDNAQQMLDAFLQDEKDTQEKVKKAQMQQQQRRKTEKEW